MYRIGVLAALTTSLLIGGTELFAQPAVGLSMTGIGSTSLTPTRIRISLPIRVRRDRASDAIAELRMKRLQVIEKATELGADPDSIRAVGFECVPVSAARTVRNMMPGGNPSQVTGEVASCFVIADFVLPPTDDFEAMLAISQGFLSDISFALDPDDLADSASSNRYYSSTIDSNRLESPVVFFVAQPTDEQIQAAYTQAQEDASRMLRLFIPAKAAGANQSLRALINYMSVPSSLRSHPVADAVGITDGSSVVSLSPDDLNYTLRVTVSTVPEKTQEN